MKKILLVVVLTLSSMFTIFAQNNNAKSQPKVLVTFFSHTGENYGVGVTEKGNTHIVAEMIAKQTGGELFEIATVKPYPKTYKECTDVAKKEKESSARPALKADVAIEDYDVIFIGYPNWWGEMPMALYTFIEKHNWQGKKIIPFCTHEGSGLSATEQSLKKSCKGAKVLSGLAMRGTTAHKEQPNAAKAVEAWLTKLNLN